MQSINNVFLIDDDGITNMINTAVIRLLNEKIQVNSYIKAGKALQDLEQLSKGDAEKLPDIIFLDINMPVIDGWEFLESFTELYATLKKKPKIYLLTSSIDLDDMKKSKNYTMVHGFISKPLTLEHLELLHDNKRLESEYLSLIKLIYPDNRQL